MQASQVMLCAREINFISLSRFEMACVRAFNFSPDPSVRTKSESNPPEKSPEPQILLKASKPERKCQLWSIMVRSLLGSVADPSRFYPDRIRLSRKTGSDLWENTGSDLRENTGFGLRENIGFGLREKPDPPSEKNRIRPSRKYRIRMLPYFT